MQAKASISKIGLDVALSCEMMMLMMVLSVPFMMMLMMVLVVPVMMMLMIYITLLIPTRMRQPQKMGALTYFCMVGVPFPNAHDVVMQQVAPHTLTPNP